MHGLRLWRKRRPPERPYTDAGGGGLLGRSSVKTHPLPGRSRTRSSPPFALAALRQMESRIFDRANAMTRDEFLALAPFAPMFAKTYHTAAMRVATELIPDLGTLAKASSIKPADMPFARGIHRSYWFAAHAILLSTMGEPGALDTAAESLAKMGMTVTGSISFFGGLSHLYRAAWTAAQIGEPLIASYEAHLRSGRDINFVLDDVAALGAIAVRHERLRPRIVGLLKAAAEALGDDDLTKPVRVIIEIMAGVISAPDDAATRAMEYARLVYTARSSHLPEGDEHRFAEPEKVPEALAKTALFTYDGDLFNQAEFKVMGMQAIPLVARAKAEDFYFERDVARKLLADWHPDDTLEIVRRQREAGHLGGLTVKSDAKPGRNEPCHCGSGKKYKKCHGA